MNFLALQYDVYRLCGWADSPAAAVSTRVKARLNVWHRKLLTKPGADWLRADVLTFASASGTNRYGLPQGVARVKQIWETTNDKRLERRDLKWLRSYHTDPAAGIPTQWIPMSWTGVATQPSNASEIFAKSTAADTATIFIEGYITGGYFRTASVALTGTTAVSLSTSITTWIAITKVYVSATCTGVVTLHEDSGAGTELARIAIGQTYPRYQSIFLVPTPNAVVTYNVDCDLEIPDMANNTDEPLLPVDFHWLISAGARRDEWLKKGDMDRFTREDADIKEGMGDYLVWLVNPDIPTPLTDVPRKEKT